MTTGRQWQAVLLLWLVVGVALFVTGCSPKTVVREVTVTKEVPVPYYQPCPRPEDKPQRPSRLASDHPVMPGTAEARELLMALKLLEWIGYGDQADAVLTECARPR